MRRKAEEGAVGWGFMAEARRGVSGRGLRASHHKTGALLAVPHAVTQGQASDESGLCGLQGEVTDQRSARTACGPGGLNVTMRKTGW